MDTSNLIVYLPFDESSTQDLLGNTWTATGNPTIQDGKLYLDGASYLKWAQSFAFTGQPFTIACKFSGTSNTTGGSVCLWQMYIGSSNRFHISISTAGILALWKDSDSTVYIKTNSSVLDGQEHHVECDFDGATWYLFLDGNLVGSKAHTCSARNYTFYLGINYSTSKYFTGTIDEFMIYDGVALHTANFTPPTADEYPNFSNLADLERNLSNTLFIPPRRVQFTGENGCYGELPLDTLAGRTTFTIEVEFSTLSTNYSPYNYNWSTIIGREIASYWQDDFGFCVNDGKLCFWANPKATNSLIKDNGLLSNAVVNDGVVHKVAVVSANNAIDLYCDGALVGHADNVNAKITDAYTILIGNNSGSWSWLQMDFYEARLWSKALAQEEIFADIAGDEDGLECWLMPAARNDLIPDISGHERHATLYGSPNVDVVDQFLFQYDADIKSTVYINADDSAGTFIYVDGGFYQTEIKKTFNLPPTYEIWLDFDVHFDGVNRWRAGNAGDNGVTGMTAELSGAASFLNCDELINSIADVCIANQLQNVCLHMISGASEGLIEARVDGLPVFYFTGDVNHGEPFKDLFLQSDGAGTYFSALLVSTSSVPPVRYRTFDFDIEAKILNSKVPWTIQRQTVSGGGDYVAGDDVEIISVDFGHEPAILIKLPPSYDMWIDFDICVDGTTTWGAGNISDHGISGIVSTNNAANFFANSISQHSAANFLPAGEFVPILLHLHSGTSDGKVETWVNGVKVQSYTGDVNHGDDFSNIFLHRDSDAVIFSNLTFSSSQLDPRRYEPTIKFCIRHNGQNISLPFRYSATPITPAVAIRHDGKNWYNKLCEHTNSLASALHIRHNNTEYALSTAV